LGNFKPEHFEREHIKDGLVNFINNKTNYQVRNGHVLNNVREPETTSSISKKKATGYLVPSDYHSDEVPNKSQRPAFQVVWANKMPTKIRNVHKGAGKYGTERPGKRVGGDIKDHDVVLLYNRKARHASPKNIEPEDNRWFARYIVDKHKKKLQENANK